MTEAKWVMKRGNCYAESILFDGKSPYSGKTEAEFIEDGCLILSEDEAMEMIYEAEEIKYVSKQWKEITEDEWWDMYEVLPPLNDARVDGYHFFFISEATTGNIHACFCEVAGKYYTSSRRTSTPYSEMILQIQKQIQKDKE